MGLNDDVDNQFGAIDDSSFIKAVDKNPTDFVPVKETDVFDEPTVAGELPKFSGLFELEEKRRNDATDLVEVRSSMNRACGVCMEDITVINNLVPGFVSDDRPLEMFTEEPTRTGYEETMQSVDAELSKQCQTMSSSVVELANGYLNLSKELGDIYAVKYPLLLSQLNTSIAKLLFTLKKDDINQISYIFSNRVRWHQLMDYPLGGVINDVMPTEGYAVVEEFKGSFLDKSSNLLVECLKNISFKRNLAILNRSVVNKIVIAGEVYQIDDENFMLSKYTGERCDESASDLTLGALFRLLESNTIHTYLKRLANTYRCEIDVLKTIEAQVQEINTAETASITEKIDPLVALSSMVSEVRHNAVGIMNIQSGIYGLLTALVCLVEDLAASQGVTV